MDKRVIFLDVNKAKCFKKLWPRDEEKEEEGKALVLSLVKSVETSLDVERGRGNPYNIPPRQIFIIYFLFTL
jgi:hypothetical protein